jgi:hypothetical protein
VLHESRVVGGVVVGREDGDAAQWRLGGDPQRAVENRWRGPAVLGLDDQGARGPSREKRTVVALVCARQRYQGPVRRHDAGDSALRGIEERLRAQDPAELLRSSVAGDDPGEGAKSLTLSPGHQQRPALIAIHLTPLHHLPTPSIEHYDQPR